MRLKIAASLLCALAAVSTSPAAAQLGTGLGPSSQPGHTAVLRGLDKVTAETRDFEAPIGEEVRFGSLTITVHYCRKRPPEETPETFVGLEVYDRATDGGGEEVEPQRIFSGWMFASSPALHPLEHPVYDVWPLDCLGSGASENPPPVLADEEGAGEPAAGDSN